MTTYYVGGLRARLIRESLYRMVYSSLAQLGWFDAGRKHSPVSFISEPVRDIQQIAVNTACLADFDLTEEDAEMGSQLAISTWRFFIDFFGEDDAVALHFSRDVKDILGGRMAHIGRTGSTFPVYDYLQATPPVVFYCDIEKIQEDRPATFAQPFDKFWYSIRFDVIDEYADESG